MSIGGLILTGGLSIGGLILTGENEHWWTDTDRGTEHWWTDTDRGTEHWWTDTDRGDRSTGIKMSAPVPLCPPMILIELAGERVRASAERDRRLTACNDELLMDAER